MKGYFLILSGLISRSLTFSTSTCDHSKVIDSLTSYEHCYSKETTAIKKMYCLSFDVADKCVHEALEPCFGDDITLMASMAQMDLRKTFQSTMRTLGFPEDMVNFLLNSCPNAPTEREADSYVQKMFYWFDFVETDGVCVRKQVEEVQIGLQECMVTQGKNFQEWLLRSIGISEEEVAKKTCKALYDTAGKCWRTKFPSCFSQREVEYIKETMNKAFKIGYNVGYELKEELMLLNSTKVPSKEDFVKCLVNADQTDNVITITLNPKSNYE